MQKFKLKPTIYFGENSLSALSKLKADNVVIITDAFMESSGTARHIAERLTSCGTVHIFSEIRPDPPIELIVHSLRFLLDNKADAVIALGGGSSIDAAKSTVMMARRSTGKNILFVAVPTTSGTGSEVTSFAVITDPNAEAKYPLVSDELLPDVSVLAPELVVSAPPAVTADTGMDVITHGLEAYISTKANDFSDALAEKALSLAFEYLPEAFDNGSDLVAREKMHSASCLAGMAFNDVGLGINHGIAHALGAVFHIPHGRANAMILPDVMEFNSSCRLRGDQDTLPARKMSHIARRLGMAIPSPKLGARNLVSYLRALRTRVGIPTTLAQCGVTKEMFEAEKEHIIECALADACTATNPRKATAEDVEKILSGIAKFR